MEDITKILAFEVKKEMADRYFGFRKRIEDDTKAYISKLTASSLDLENRIGFDLIRLYILLQKEELIREFLNLVNLPREFFYDPYTITSPTIRKRVFSGLKCHGFSRKGRFRKMFMDTYRSLAKNIEDYRTTLAELTEEQQTIHEEINIFYRKNDIDGIMSFIRRLDSPDSGSAEMMQTAVPLIAEQQLSTKMRLHPPIPAGEMLPHLPSLPPPESLQPRLDNLLNEAYRIPRLWRIRDMIKKND
jgi:hypothetical protein